MGKIYSQRVMLGGRRLAMLGVLASLGATAPLACGGSSPAPVVNKGSGTLGGKSAHAIHVFAGAPGGPKTQLNFGPGTEIALNGQSKLLSSAASSSFEGGVPLVTAPSIDDPGSNIDETAWALVARAADTCGAGVYAVLPPWAIQGSYPSWYVFFPQRQTSITRQIPNCSSRLASEQSLLCIADKLAEIGDAVGNVVWPAAPNVVGSGSSQYTYGSEDGGLDTGSLLFYSQWTIPPQSDGDRFIVRDLAIHTLGMIPVLDAYTDLGNQTCATNFAQVAAGGTTEQNAASLALFTNTFGADGAFPPANVFPYFPPSTVPFFDSAGNNNSATIAASALALEAQILTSGGQLLHDAIRRDVYSDMAAAAQQAAQVMDPTAGNQLAWGVTSQLRTTNSPPDPFGLATSSTPYGSIAHAARVLMGRWEIGDETDFPSTYQPQCEGVAALDLVSGAFGSDLAARVLDLPITTPGEATASQLVDQAGIVVSQCAINASIQTSPFPLRQALIDQLVTNEQLSNGLPVDTGATNQLEIVFNNALQPVADAEIAFAFQRALSTYLLLTSSSDPSVTSGADGGSACTIMQVATPTGSPANILPGGLVAVVPTSGTQLAVPVSVTGAGVQGIVISGGISRSRLQTDPMGRAAGMLEASQCGETADPQWTQWGQLNPPINVPYTLPVADFQDVFHVGQAFERQLVKLDALAFNNTAIASAVGAGTNPDTEARSGIAELRTWAGTTIVHSTVSGSALSVQVDGMSNAQLGIASALTPTSASNVLGLFGFVYGPPWMAECAAGLRANCPTKLVQAPSQISVISNAANGVVDNSFVLTVPMSGNFSPPLGSSDIGSTSASHIYMVLLQDPTLPSGHGRVMGVIRTGCTSHSISGSRSSCVQYDTFSFVDAPMQRELVHDAIDLGKWVGATPPALGDPSSAQTSGYCVDGVPRDLFVPLDNELVNGGQSYEDSWQNYLSLAQTAAQTADTLGQQLIADDLQISENEQSAAEQVANLCGSFGSLSTVTVGTDGTTNPGASDTATANCLNEQTTDIVFLGALPGKLAGQGTTITADTNAYIQGPYVLNCNPTDGGAPNTSPLCQPGAQISFDSLGIVAQEDAGPPANVEDGGIPLSADCMQILGTIQPSLAKSFQGTPFVSALQQADFATSAIQVLVSQLKMTVDYDDQWQVLFADAPLMSSSNASYWPACLTDGEGCASIAKSNPTGFSVATYLNQAFRWCPAGNLQQALGCDGAQSLSASYPSASPQAAAAELNMIRWRVMQAMWLLAVSQGDLPQGMFSLPIPVSMDPTESWPIVYPDSLVDAGSSLTIDNLPALEGWIVPASPATSSTEATAFGATGPQVYDIAPQFSWTTDNALAEMPVWYKNIYQKSQSSEYQPIKHIMVTNADTPLGETPFGFLEGGKTPGANPNTVYDPELVVMRPGLVATAQAPQPLLWQILASVNGSVAEASVQSVATGATPVSGQQSTDGLLCQNPWGESTKGLIPMASTAGQSWQVGAGSQYNVTVPSLELPWSIAGFGMAVSTPIAGPVQLGVGVNVIAMGNLINWNTSAAPSSAINLSVSSAPPSSYQKAGIPATALSPTQRAPLFIGAANTPEGELITYSQMKPGVGSSGEILGASFGTCNALSTILRAATIACVASPSASANMSEASQNQVLNASHPPTITTANDIIALEGWLSAATQVVSGTVGSLYVLSMPVRVVNDFKTGQVGSGNIGGSKGQSILDMEENLEALPSAWNQIAVDLAGIQGALQSAQIAIVAAQLQDETSEESVSMEQIRTQAQMAQAVTGFLSTVVSASGSVLGSFGSSLAQIPIAAVSLEESLSSGNAELGVLNQETATLQQVEDNNLAAALATMDQSTSRLWGDVTTQVDNVRAAVAKIMADGQQLQLIEGQAAYQVALGTGADFVNISGQEVPIPVDTVLRRQASATEQRYATALLNAKALAYMARRAIEQRIGVTLDAITVPVGPLDAPASWADDICSLQGVNYASLSTAVPTPGDEGGADGGGIGGSQDVQAISQFADAWVGDYVAKLQNFVTYYNAQYPSHQGSDTAVVSLRYDLLDPVPQCTATGPNLLVNSGDLDVLVDPAVSASGWQLATCASGASKCLSVLPGVVVAPPQGGPAGGIATPPTAAGADDAGTVVTPLGLPTGVSWLLDVVPQMEDAGPVEAGLPNDGGSEDGAASQPAGTPSAVPANQVAQQVQLQAGTYVLSWWDQARNPQGNLLVAPASPAPYSVTIYNAGWQEVGYKDPTPFTPASVTAAVLWSGRINLSFSVSTAGTYYVAFSASIPGQSMGSVAIADVQLELAAASGQPTTYIGTGGSLQVQSTNCPPSDSDLRAAFQHNCDQNNVCSYDLMAPLVLNTQSLNASTTALNAKLAAGNYNYRHDTLALNLVGTGVHDCSNDPSQDCFGSGYVQYDLIHNATNAGILDYSGNERVFDFGIATINHGKALAAEQYITMPVSSDDQALISQPGIEHEEFSGRPLDGAYTLRIWDSPDLDWSALQDVQIVFNYEYWSAIQVSGNTGDLRHQATIGHPRAKPIPRRRRH